MLFRIVPSPKGALSLRQVLQLTDMYLENASKTDDHDIVLVLCQHAEVALSEAKSTFKKASSSSNPEDQVLSKSVATAYYRLGKLLENQDYHDQAQEFFKKSKKLEGYDSDLGQHSRSSQPVSIAGSIKSITTTATNTSRGELSQGPTSSRSIQLKHPAIPKDIFTKNVRPPAFSFISPEPDSRLSDTLQLACCLALLQGSHGPDDVLDAKARKWLSDVRNEPDEHERLKALATDVIRAFKRDEFKDDKAVTEVVYLSPILNKDDFRYLLKEFYSGIDQSTLLDVHQLEGLAQLIQGADSTYLDADDLVKVLELLSTRLQGTHQQSLEHRFQLTFAVSNVLDAMADANVKELDRETIHAPLLSYLDGLKGSSDPYLVYQAAYAYQALLYVPDNESLWQATVRRSGKVIKGISGLVSAVKGLDLNAFVQGLEHIQQGLAGALEVIQVIKDAYVGASSLAQGGQGFLKCLEDGLSFDRKSAWYPALRGADTMIRDGQLSEFKKLVCEAPCRGNVAFQWGVCQRLGEVAANTMWSLDVRQDAIAFLGEIYRKDSNWGQQAAVKQWILDILMQLSIQFGVETNAAETLLQELQTDGDITKQTLYKQCRENGSASHPLKISLAALASPSLLDRVQERPAVEGNIRQLRRQRLKERGNVVYIPPQAKPSLQARDNTEFPLMEKVEEFLSSQQLVFLLLGESGSGKSTFNRQLECHLWESYKKSTGTIPLFINLPAIDKPEHDMIAKQLRRREFTEPQIRELKLHRSFILICDGYDESQHTHNLYTSNQLNEPGEWKAKMVINCRSEYIGVDYRDRFQPGNRNQRSESSLFQEAVITPFSWSQVNDYIDQYVSMHRPLWKADEYKKALDHIPSLRELVRNPFLMSLSLEVLPRIVDPEQNLSDTKITRVALYDQFIEHWLERGKKRLGEKKLRSQARSALESLNEEGFVQSGINYLKRLSKEIYRNQDGQPIVQYSRYKDEDTWKAEFFSRDEEKRLLREACPFIRNGNQHRFIHRSLLEYGLTLAVFDPQDWKEGLTVDPNLNRRGSGVSAFSFDAYDPVEGKVAMTVQEPDPDSPLCWRYFVNEPSVLQFLEERVQKEPLFKQQLLEYIELSKIDKKWRRAASNAITVLVRVGVQFIRADLRGIQIPKADLSYGMFDSAQFQEADLRQVDLRGAWLRNADLSNSHMTSAKFGELPYLEQDCEVSKCVYSPDGKLLSVALQDGTISVYSTSTWEEQLTMEGQANRPTIVAFSPNGNRLATGNDDNEIRFYDIDAGVYCHAPHAHDDKIHSLLYSPDGDQVASGSGQFGRGDCTVKLWDAESGTCSHILIGHWSRVLTMAYSPMGNYIVSGSEDTTARLWNIVTQECCHILYGHRSFVVKVAYSPQGHQVASASQDSTVRLWDVVTGECLHVLEGHTEGVLHVVYSPNGSQIASSPGGNSDKSVRLWDTTTGMCLHALDGNLNYFSGIVYSPQGDVLASSGGGTAMILWDTETGVSRQVLTGHASIVSHMEFSPKGNQVASCSWDKTVRLWDLGTGTSRLITGDHTGAVRKVVYSSKRSLVATCSLDSTARIWSLETGACVHVLRGHIGVVFDIAFSPQGEHIATCGDLTVRIWDLETGSCVRILSDDSSLVFTVAYSPEGEQLASSGGTLMVRLWDAATGNCQHTLHHRSNVYHAKYSPTGRQIGCGSWDGAVYVWDTTTGECVQSLNGHVKSVNCLAFSPQGDQLISCSDDNTVRLWDIGTGQCQYTFIDQCDGISPISFSPEGDRIVYCCRNGLIQVRQVTSGICFQTLVGHTKAVGIVAFSPQGDILISKSSEDMTVRLWDVASGQCLAVIEEVMASVNDFKWIETSDHTYLVVACHDGVVGMWQVTSVGDQLDVRLCWRTTRGKLTMANATIQDARGLSRVNRKLLKQRGAVGEPVDSVRQASKRLISMASAVSKLQSARSGMSRDIPSDSILSTNQREHEEQIVEP